MHTHRLIKKTAVELAGAFYEIKASRDNEFFKRFPNQRRFIEQDWRGFVPTAREVLTDMLTGNECTDHVKREIHHALIHDRALENGMLVRPDALH